MNKPYVPQVTYNESKEIAELRNGWEKECIASNKMAGLCDDKDKEIEELKAENGVLREQNMDGVQENKRLRDALEILAKNGPISCGCKQIAKQALGE